jgi:hypothetical protein
MAVAVESTPAILKRGLSEVKGLELEVERGRRHSISEGGFQIRLLGVLGRGGRRAYHVLSFDFIRAELLAYDFLYDSIQE